jgi:hypothetical protein
MLNKNLPGTEVIVVSSFPSSQRIRKWFKKYKVADFFSKDEFDKKDFLNSVRECFENVWEKYLVVWINGLDGKRKLKIENQCLLSATCQNNKSPGYEYVPFWLRFSLDVIRLRIVVYAQGMDVQPVVDQPIEIFSTYYRAEPVKFSLIPGSTGKKQITLDLYHEDRLLASLDTYLEII